jgi:hypothetical protein
MYYLFCVVFCIVCVYMCTVLLPPCGYPIAVKYIISILAPPLLWLLKHANLRAYDLAHSPILWHQPKLPNFTCTWSRRRCGKNPVIPNKSVIRGDRLLGLLVHLFLFLQICFFFKVVEMIKWSNKWLWCTQGNHSLRYARHVGTLKSKWSYMCEVCRHMT